jgi:multimeric flavodoxin WrbA
MSNKKVIILGSSSSNGNTRKVVDYISANGEWDVIDLNDFRFGYFDYDHKNMDDDFLPLMNEVLSKYKKMLFATPVYWYNMSGVMKVFFDRISDLITVEKKMGRKLAGREVMALSCSNGENANPAFFFPFKATAGYLDMVYKGDLHVQLSSDELTLPEMQRIDTFVNN